MSRLTLSFVLFAAVSACMPSDEEEETGEQLAELAELVCGVNAGAVDGTYHTDFAPEASNGPTATVTSPAVVINGGTAQATVAGSDRFSRVVVGVAGSPGYYDVALPDAADSVDLQLSLCQDLALPTLDLTYAVGTSASVGEYEEQPAAIIEVGTGEVQVSVSWDTDSDVDLHVTDPAGDEVYYGQTVVDSSGMLDLDSNPGCNIDGVNNENITWSAAPQGDYTVRLDYFKSCDVEATSYVVTVQRMDEPVETFSGELTGDGDEGGAGAGIDITSFTVE
ncbi:MAG TPA: hypothetical protein VK698_18565 [Kofleriaceae bacterium]|nr:hypothetical protein [Kofleriaceae bacterium]